MKKSNRQRKMEKEMIHNVWRSWLYALPILIGFMALSLSLSLGFFIVGLSGVIVAVKKEMPSGIVIVRGPVAIITGVLVTILFWGIAAYFFPIEFLR